jgi:riboflavin kinase/FMN adenylyltransferase
MNFIHNFHSTQSLKFAQLGAVVTIGNFDGLHFGHQEILAQVIAKACELQLPTVAVTFAPHPREFFDHCQKGMALMTLREKVAYFKKIGIDNVVCLRFKQNIAILTAEEFVQKVLVDFLNVKHLFVGYDFSFGYKKHGTISLLKKLALKYGFQVTVIAKVTGNEGNEIRISSTLVREFLRKGDLEAVTKFLGRNYSICGHIIHGKKLGRELEFPTANISVRNRIIPPSGVYVVKVFGAKKNKVIFGVANIGFRPTVSDLSFPLLEFYLFDFSEDIYGKIVEVEFLHKLRAEKKFADFAELKTQIAKDVKLAKEWMKKNY